MSKYWTCEFCDFIHTEAVKVCLCSEALLKHYEENYRRRLTLEHTNLFSCRENIDHTKCVVWMDD